MYLVRIVSTNLPIHFILNSILGGTQPLKSPAGVLSQTSCRHIKYIRALLKISYHKGVIHQW